MHDSLRQFYLPRQPGRLSTAAPPPPSFAQAEKFAFNSMPQDQWQVFLDPDGLHMTETGYNTLGDLVFDEVVKHLCIK